MELPSLFSNNPRHGVGKPPITLPSDNKSIKIEQSTRLEIVNDFEAFGVGWIWASDKEGRLIYLSQSALEVLQLDCLTLLGQPLVELFETDDGNPEQGNARPLNFRLTSRSKLKDLVVRLIPASKKGGYNTWWSISAHPKFDEDGKFAGYRGSAKDVTIEYQHKLEESRLAEFDSLTGLANRHRMTRRLDSAITVLKCSQRTCALLMLDLDRFKQVNDTMGHMAGDELLRQVAERLRNIIGNRGEIGRLGGDEFQVILPDLDDRGKLGELADKLIQIVSQPYPIDGKRAIIGTSVGIAIAPYDGAERDELVRSADLALYAAKNGGRGGFRFYSADLKDEEEERALLVDDLREALANDQLELHYQPVVRTSDNMVVAFEALMRWEHEERGFVGPGMFIPVSEEANLINSLGEWALRTGCQEALNWPSSVRLAVNVSAVQFANSGFVEIVTNALDESGLEPDRLELELTESIFMGDSEMVDNTFRTLKELGVRLALDDFGTGYSSLSYLRTAPFDKIKVDKTFVDSCTDKAQNSAKIITAIIGLSEALGLETTVEGVEAFDQLDLVISKGAKFVQGWIYSKALRSDEIMSRMNSGEFKIEPDGPNEYRAERRSMFRRIGVIHDNYRYDAIMRDLSKTGSLIGGLVGVPKGTKLVLDLGEGQLVVCNVAHSRGDQIGVEFETPLVSDGAGGLCTRHRVSPYALAAAGMPLTSSAPGNFSISQLHGGERSSPQFLQM